MRCAEAGVAKGRAVASVVLAVCSVGFASGAEVSVILVTVSLAGRPVPIVCGVEGNWGVGGGCLYCWAMEKLTLFFAKGTAPSKWCTRFEERGLGRVELREKDDAFAALRVATPEADASAAGDAVDNAAPGHDAHDAPDAAISGGVEVALVRLPDPRVDRARERGLVHVVRLYEEQPGVVLPKEHELTLLDQVRTVDFAEEIVHYAPEQVGPVDVRAVREAVMVVAANVGVACAPRPLLRSLNNKDTEHRDLVDGVPTEIAAVFAVEDDGDLVQDFIGITKGRKPQSSRQTAGVKLTAREKTLAKQARASQSGGGQRATGGSRASGSASGSAGRRGGAKPARGGSAASSRGRGAGKKGGGRRGSGRR